MQIVIIGLALSSSWGNGHATTWRALIRGLAAEGHRVTFLERDVPWYAAHRDLAVPGYCDLILYRDLPGLMRHRDRIGAADAVVVGSYVPDGAAVIDAVAPLARRLAFYDIDTPVTLDLLERREETCLARRQMAGFDLCFSFTGGPILRHLETRWGARAARALYCAVDAEAHGVAEGAALRWDLGYLGTYAEDRQPGLEALLLEPARRMPKARFVVAGPQYPDTIDWPANVERIDHLPPAGHAAFYTAQRFTLNLTRAAMRAWGWAPSVRLFEAAACGVPILSDRWEGIGDVLPEGQAVTIVDGTDDVIAALRMPEAQRQAQARAARDRVLADHTGAARAREMAAALERLPARREATRWAI